MASLKFIMDVDDDEPEPHQNNKRDKDPAPAPSSSSRPDPSPSSSSSSAQAYSSHVSSPNSQAIQRNLGPAVAASPTAAAAAAAARSFPSSSSPNRASRPATAPTSLPRPSARRRSTTSNDSMDQTGYAPATATAAGPSSSRGPGLAALNNTMRPMPNPTSPDIPVKLTPITGRVSRARKGVPVHTCDICKPPKTFTRAEHLRRHQLGHQTPGFPCPFPHCGRAFHRADLLARHQQRHEQDGDKGDKGGDEDDGRLSLEDSLPRLDLQSQAGSSPVMSGPSGSGTSNADTPSTPSTATTSAPGYQQLRSPGGVSNPSVSPGNTGTSGHYSFSPRGSHDYQYSPSPSASAMSTSPNLDGGPMAPTSYTTSMEESYQQPRSTPSIFVVTQGLSLPSLHIPDVGPPDLYHHDASPWTSSASDSTYSTPASDISRSHRYWMPRHRSPTATDWPSSQLLSPYPNAVSREPQSPGPTLETVSAPASMFMDTFPHSSSFSAAPQNDFGGVLALPVSSSYTSAVPIPSPSSASTFRAHHQHHDSISSLGSPNSPQMAPSHAAEALVAPMQALPTRISSIASLGRQKEMVMDVADAGHAFMSDASAGFDLLGGMDDTLGDGNLGRMGCDGGPLTLDLPLATGCVLPGQQATSPLPRATCTSIPRYLEVYWRRFHPQYPVVHRPTFEASGEDVLRCAMAAVATQYLDNKEDREKGNQLHEYAWQEAKRVPQWSLQVLQAILLCELFARFRGRKAVTRPSKQFESLYSRVLYNSPAMFDPALVPPEQHLPRGNRWQEWLDAEARRRLLTACFIVDAHTSIYQQQRRAQEYTLSGPGVATPPIPLTARSAALWEASSAVEWAGLLAADPEAGSPIFTPMSSVTLTLDDIANRPEFDRAAMLALELLRLQRRPSVSADLPAFLGADMSDFDMDLDPLTIGPAVSDNSLSGSNGVSVPTVTGPAFPPVTTPSPRPPAEEQLSRVFAGPGAASGPRANVYLALHHTPLHDLLAVSGESWLFSQKVLEKSSFTGNKRRTKAWAGQHHAVSATIYAARAILGFLAAPRHNNSNNHVNNLGGGDEVTTCLPDISDYWGLYVCALVCWAFGHSARRVTRVQGQVSTGDMGTTNGNDDDGEALAWLRRVADAGWPGEAGPVIVRREEGSGVVRLVRRRLERDCVGVKSRLYVDAVRVLKSLEEGTNWKWF